MLASPHLSIARTKAIREGTRTLIVLENIPSPLARHINIQIIPSEGVLLDIITRCYSPSACIILHHNSCTNASKPNPLEVVTGYNSILCTSNDDTSKSLIWMTPRGRVAEVVFVQLRAINVRVDVSADTTIMDFVVVDVGFSCLDADPDIVARDIIVSDFDRGDIVHADANEATWKNNVMLDICVLRPDGQHAVLRSVANSVLRHVCILRSKHSDVEARKALDCEARDFGVFDWFANGFNLLVLAVERLIDVYDLGACDADACLGAVSCEVGARIGDWCTRWNDGSVLADEGDSILSDGELLGVRAAFNDDLVASRCFVKSSLDAFARFDMDGIAVRVCEDGVEEGCADRCDDELGPSHGELR